MLQKDNTVGLAIDIQERLWSHVINKIYLQQQVKKMITGFQVLEIPIIVTEQNPKGLGPTISSLTDIFEKPNRIVEKFSFSCCANDDFLSRIKSHRASNVILCGIESHVCVLQTALDLKYKGYKVYVAADAVSSQRIYDKNVALRRMQQEGILLTTVESVLFELMGSSNNEKFKSILKIIKGKDL